MNLRYYKLLSVLLLLDIIAIVFFLTMGNFILTIACAALAVLILITQVLVVKCPHCGAHPGLWILVVWTLLLITPSTLPIPCFCTNVPNAGPD